jgi:hypothetical protein
VVQNVAVGVARVHGSALYPRCSGGGSICPYQSSTLLYWFNLGSSAMANGRIATARSARDFILLSVTVDSSLLEKRACWMTETGGEIEC